MVFALILSILLLFSVSGVFAGDNETISDVVSAPSELEEITQEHEIMAVQSSQSDGGMLEASNNVINVHVYDSYNETGKTWTEDGIQLKGATVKLYDSSNNLISTQTTNNKGIVSFTGLGSQKYNLELTYSTYNPIKLTGIDFTGKEGSSLDINDVMFVPDILLLVDYASHNEKVDVLMNMSRRVAYISTTNFDESRVWLAEYAKYIHIDMFAENSAYNKFTASYLKQLLAVSPANANYKVAYTFGTYTQQIMNATGIHIIGANAQNNTYDTVENTYIGSYFQAEDIQDSGVLLTNMKNYFNYVRYLLEPSKYSNPTLTDEGIPLMSPECGFYHPDLGMYTLVPEASLIHQWITKNPGYSKTQDGSLNWMKEEYEYWVEHTLNPQELFNRFEDDFKAKFNPDKKLIAIATYYCGGDVVDSLIRSYAASGRPAFNIFKTSTTPSMSSILNRITNSSKIGISTITSLYSWSLSYANGSAEPDLSEIDLAVLKGVNEISEYSYNSDLGPQVEWTYAVTFPSFEGVYGPVILSYVDGEGKTHVIQSGVDKMVKLSCGWADLKDLGNSDKTIAIVLYNYPPGKAEIGASYLNVTQSTYDLIVKLYEQGYDTGGDIRKIMTARELEEIIFKMGNKGSWAYGLLRQYVEDNYDELVKHHQLISTRDFRQLIKDIPQSLIKNMTDYWGSGLGPSMVYNGTDEQYMVVPGIWFGKVFITFQPSRGWEELKTVENYHDLTLPPTQYYVSFYKWLDKTAKVNAIVNMGTHGTLEWLPGTNLGAVEGDWTFELTLNPTIYPYIVSNPGEAMVARDRIAALLITHMTPAMVTSGLYGNYTVLNNYINYYKDQVNLNVTSNAEEYKVKILKLAPSLGFRNFTGKNETFQQWLDDLHLYLEAMEDDFITYGLHTLGKILTGDELVEEVITITTSQTKIYNQIMEFLYPEFAGKSFYDDIQGNLKYLAQASMIKQFLRSYVEDLVNGSSIDELATKYSIPVDSALYNSTRYAAQVIVNIQNNNEWNAILTALEGGYVKSGLFADPSYGDSIPTGYDGYAADPTRMPSESAYESAVKIVDLLLSEYYEKHGSWPELTSLILWGTEISRTEGIGVAEFLYFLGCKPVWLDNGKVIGVKMLPLSDLTVKLSNGSVVNRPRIDVFASIVTSNKDWLTWMLTATKLAAFAPGENETNNYVIKHYKENPSLDRLFGLPGNVLEGTGMSTLIPNTADWNISTVNQFAMDVYLSRVSYSWTIDEQGNLVITNQKENFKYLLNKTDLITQNFDSTWRLFDSDDYYDWFGGLYNAASVLKEQSGQSRPDTSFVDIRSKNNYVARTYEEEIEFEIRSMLLNPKYYMPLVTGGGTGMNSYAARIQNMFGGLTVANDKLGTEVGNQLANELLGMSQYVDGATTSAGYQTSLAWMIYLAGQGTWQTDMKTYKDLVNEYMDQATKYGVACCHHTCKNLAWNAEIIQMSSLTPAQKAKFAEILAQATNTDPLYTMPEEDTSSNPQDGGGSTNGASDAGNDNSNAQDLVNGTSSDKTSSEEGGKTAVGADGSESGDAKSASESQSAQSSSSDGAGESGAQAFELSEKSAAKSASATESSMPMFVVIAVIVLIAIFLVGYWRDDDDEYDDY
ncbi:MAG: cobaltochelatase subunit CobN [Methanobrevibacter sp.]|uniref:cobaltochelatase subunit CobN n=1 Tax=Methanobrevibacter sp. TaxID=66852 RepID=UPI001B609A62|nr:cobaltochelatase subunit CobN [Methanobrevibacter sp.]MBP3790443.1 cobaltochelatase subunit CobN [Methanobrevibacter sp.]